MAALRAGDGAASRKILTALLPELRSRVEKMEASRAGGAADEVVLPSWRLVYALTLNNYGCQLRRDGQSAAALQQFMLAKEVESRVFGKPSCSTMLNLSAVLLSQGEAKAALKIATECAAAAQDGEPVLFITALHNLAVVLGQQLNERSRSAALPTMLQALREAQAALGEQHPTTTMLREKCGLTSEWITTSTSPATSTTLTTQQQQQSESGFSAFCSRQTPPSASPRPSFSVLPHDKVNTAPAGSARERARAALHTLNFGVQLNTVPSQRAPSRPLSAVDSKSAAGEGEASSPALADSLPADRVRSTSVEATLPVGGKRLPALPLVDNRGDVRTSLSTAGTAAGGVGRNSDVAASVDKLCLDSNHLSPVELSISGNGPETVLQEPFHASTLGLLPRGATTLRELCGVGQDGSQVYPSFLRFSAPLPAVASRRTSAGAKTEFLSPAHPFPHASEDSTASTSGRQEPTSAFAQTAPVKSRVVHDAHSFSSTKKSAVDSETRNDAVRAPATTPPRVNQSAKGSSSGCSPPPPTTRRTLFGHSGSRWPDRAAQRQADLEEEQAFRRKLKAEEEAAEAARAFERGLERVRERTRARAARVVQRVWRQWWTSVGQPRRHVQLQRLEELQRRRRDRLAVASAPGKRPTSKSHTVTLPPLPSQQHGRVAGYIVPAVVVRCAKKWMEKTACVRHAARLTGCALDAQVHEADLRSRVARVQALWRGALQRLHCTHDDEHDANANAQRADAEARDYAAMVVQRAYRRFEARQRLRRLYQERNAAPASTIQQWLRRTWADQRQRGVDAPTLRRRNAAALCIQRVWRGYQGRLAFRMRELRRRIDQANPYVLGIGAADQKSTAASPSFASASGATALPDKSELPPRHADDVSTPLPMLPLHSANVMNACAEEWLQRGPAVQRLVDAEREAFHIPLYVETMAAKERTAWKEAIRLRPSDVVRRRAQFESSIKAEQAHFVRHRAARTIQRAFREWRAMRHDPSRDTGLLQYSLLRYQQQKLGKAVDQKQRARDMQSAVRLYGDSAAPMRAECELAATALAAAAAESDSNANPAEKEMMEAEKCRTFPESSALNRAQRRRQQEALLHRDERVLALTQAHSAAHLREGPEECEARLGTTYEHPYYNPYVNEEHWRTLGID
jgi:hypothetical protein